MISAQPPISVTIQVFVMAQLPLERQEGKLGDKIAPSKHTTSE
jgi:hypothetical protein